MANKKIKSESYGTQRQTWAGGAGAGSNFQHGKDLGTHTRGSLGTRGADSNWSRASQAVMPLDAFTHFLDEDEELDEDVVVENSRYSLVEVVNINESLGDVALDLLGDTGAAAISLDPSRTVSTASGALFIIKNLYEIKKGREKADEIIYQFLRNPTEAVVEEMSDIFDGLVTDIIDLMQRSLEVIPDPSPASEATSLAASVVSNLSRAKKILKGFFTTMRGGTVGAVAGKTVRRMSLFAIVSPVIKFIMKVFNSDYAPEKILENKSMIMGTILRIVLLGDLIEDYFIQKEVALSVGIPEDQFKYRHKLLRPGQSIDTYDYEQPFMAEPVEDRVRQEEEDLENEFADRYPEYSEGLFGPDAVDFWWSRPVGLVRGSY
jgi:hypothetical protein